MSESTEGLVIALVITVIVALLALAARRDARKKQRERDEVWALAAALGYEQEE